MATVDEILTRQAYAAGDGTWTRDNDYPSYTLYVEPEYVPVTNKRIADFNDQVSVRGEQNAQFVGFQLPRYDDGLDLTAAHLYIHYQTVYGGSDSVPCNVSWSDNHVRMCWQVPAQATQEPDRVQMMIYATGANSMGERVTWKTLPTSYTIHDGLDIGGGIPEPDTSWYEQFVAQMEGKVLTAQGHANDAQASKTAAAGSAAESAQSAAASAKALNDNKAYVESQKETFVGYNRRETDTKYANALVGSASGTGRVTVGDAWEAPVSDMDISGRSEQFSTTGAQLLDLSSVNKSAGGAVVNYADGGYSISGTGALTASFTASYTLDKNVLKPGNLILKSELTIPKLYVRIWDGNTVLAEMQGNSTKQITQEMIDNDNVRVECFLYGNTGSTITPGTYHPMLYQSGDGTWEPYTGGKPSPSPDYPQPIISTGTVSTGAQLFDASKMQSTQGVTWSVSDGGRIIKVSGGVATGRAMYELEKAIGRTLYISGTIASKSVSDAKTVIVLCVKKADDSWEYKYIRDIGIKGLIYAQIPNDAKQVRLDFNINDSNAPLTTVNTAVFKDVIISVDDPKPWEPYTGGKPSPSPEYPQTMAVKATGANLLIPQITTVGTGMSATVTDNGKIHINGTPADDNNRDIYLLGSWRNVASYIPSGQYTLSCNHSGLLDSMYAISNATIIASTSSDILTFMVTDEQPLGAIMLHLKATAYDCTLGFMLNVGPTPLPYHPYQSCAATITLTEPLRGIGDYRDRIMCRDGVWGIERQFVSLIFDGSEDENWGNITTNTDEKKRLMPNGIFGLKPTNTLVASPGLSNLFGAFIPAGNAGTFGANNGISIDNAGNLIVYCEKYNTVNSLPAWKEFLQSNNLIVVAPLSTPTWEPLPSATQSALNALTTYTGTTHVTITAGGPEPDVGLGYVQDTRAVIADLQAQIKEIRNGGTI